MPDPDSGTARSRSVTTFLTRPLIAGLALGSIGFIAGFLGPIALSPDANQGPLLGIFITGPMWTVVGIVFGLLAAATNLRLIVFRTTLAILAAIAGTSTLYFSLGEDRYQGFIVDAEITNCQMPTALVPAATAWWQTEDKENTWQELRLGWKDDIAMMVENDRGVVLALKVHRKREIYEQRKPWNYGHLRATHWEPGQNVENYFARYEGSSCSGYAVGSRKVYAPEWEASQAYTPDNLPSFLRLFVLEQVPVRFQKFVAD